MSTLELPFSLEQLEHADAPLIRVRHGSDGGPVEATAARRVRATPGRVWSTISDVQSYAGRIPMMDSVKVDGRIATVHLRFGLSLFSARFSFKVERELDEGRAVNLRYVDGEPRDLHIKLEVLPASTPETSLLYATIGFDAFSVGWLAKFFLKHHPEIRYGIYPGAASALLDTMRRVSETGR
ncbi:MAG: SRPBCC family protein [Polyangiales bacterium]